MDKKNYYSTYLDKLGDRFEQFIKTGENALRNREFLCKYIWAQIKTISYFDVDECMTREEIETNLKMIFLIKNILSIFTTEELERTFPIEKRYDGKKYGIKDYFYTKNRLKEFEAGKPIAESGDINKLLWDYQNDDINLFIFTEMDCLDAVRKLDGLPSMAEEFFQGKGIDVYHKYTDENTGKEFLISKNGKTIPLAKKRPPHLKVIKGGKR